jgi:putative DNA primase/helicase
MAAFDASRAICREAAAASAATLKDTESKGASPAALSKAATVAAVVRLAMVDRRIAATTDQWDADPWLLNTPDGVVDLRTGKMRPQRPEDYITKICSVSPGGECPTFMAFMDRITNRSEDLLFFIRRMLGYCLTGITREQALFFAAGLKPRSKP